MKRSLDLNEFKAPGESNSSGNPGIVPGLLFLELMAAAGDPSKVNHAAKAVIFQSNLPHDYYPGTHPGKTV